MSGYWINDCVQLSVKIQINESNGQFTFYKSVRNTEVLGSPSSEILFQEHRCSVVPFFVKTENYSCSRVF